MEFNSVVVEVIYQTVPHRLLLKTEIIKILMKNHPNLAVTSFLKSTINLTQCTLMAASPGTWTEGWCGGRWSPCSRSPSLRCRGRGSSQQSWAPRQIQAAETDMNTPGVSPPSRAHGESELLFPKRKNHKIKDCWRVKAVKSVTSQWVNMWLAATTKLCSEQVNFVLCSKRLNNRPSTPTSTTPAATVGREMEPDAETKN